MGPALLAMPLIAAFAASPQLFQDGLESACEVDSDNDRLANCVELAMQTSRFDADTDSDGLGDGDEAFGTPGALDLPALGAHPRRRDILLEMDWVQDNAGCALHTHRPPVAAIEEVKAIFAAIPSINPDGTSGVNLIVDYGQGPPFTGGSLIAAPASGNISMTELQQIYLPAHFAINRRGYFRYSIHAHHLQEAGFHYSGVAVGDANLVTLGCQYDHDGYQRNVMAHELGHNLGLLHGGDDACENKPNYNSLMSYNVLYHGLDIDCDRFSDGIDFVGFSQGTRRPLHKSSLVEQDGVCPAGHPLAKPVDWNLNGVIDAQPVALDLACPGVAVITDFDDVANMDFTLRAPPDAAEPPPADEGETCPPPPDEGVPP